MSTVPTLQRALSGSLNAPKLVNSRYNNKVSGLYININAAFNDLINIIVIKGSLKVKARDLQKYANVWSPARKVRLGKLLTLLKMTGLAEKVTPRTGGKFRLTPQLLWLEFFEICGSLPPNKRYQCVKHGSLCGLYGECPYCRVKRLLGVSEE